jgi:hypothetical protein
MMELSNQSIKVSWARTEEPKEEGKNNIHTTTGCHGADRIDRRIGIAQIGFFIDLYEPTANLPSGEQPPSYRDSPNPEASHVAS